MGKNKARNPLEIRGRRWEDNITMDFNEVSSEDVDWICRFGTQSSGVIFKTQYRNRVPQKWNNPLLSEGILVSK